MRPFVRTLAATLAASAILSCLVVPVLGKEFLQARLDAPIALGTPPGTEILVGVTVDDGAAGPVVGSPIQLIITGRYGTTTRAAGAADGKPGHYAMRITIPNGGARKVEVVMHGTSDLPITLTADPFTFGGVTARTAQVAPALAPPMTPFPRASAAAGAPVASVPAPDPGAAATPTPAPAAEGIPPVAAVGLIGLAAVLVVGVLGRVRRSRATRLVAETRRVPGA